MTKMFYGCESLLDLDFPNFKGNSKTKRYKMFDGCTLLQKNNFWEKLIQNPNTNYCINF